MLLAILSATFVIWTEIIINIVIYFSVLNFLRTKVANVSQRKEIKKKEIKFDSFLLRFRKAIQIKVQINYIKMSIKFSWRKDWNYASAFAQSLHKN